MHNFSSRTLWKTSLSQLPAPAVPPDETKPWIHWVFRRQHSRTPMSDAECGRKLYTDVLAHFRRSQASLKQIHLSAKHQSLLEAFPLIHVYAILIDSTYSRGSRFESDSESPLGIQKLNVGFSNWTSDSETTDVVLCRIKKLFRRFQKLLRGLAYSEPTPFPNMEWDFNLNILQLIFMRDQIYHPLREMH